MSLLDGEGEVRLVERAIQLLLLLLMSLLDCEVHLIRLLLLLFMSLLDGEVRAIRLLLLLITRYLIILAIVIDDRFL